MVFSRVFFFVICFMSLSAYAESDAEFISRVQNMNPASRSLVEAQYTAYAAGGCTVTTLSTIGILVAKFIEGGEIKACEDGFEAVSNMLTGRPNTGISHTREFYSNTAVLSADYWNFGCVTANRRLTLLQAIRGGAHLGHVSH